MLSVEVGRGLDEVPDGVPDGVPDEVPLSWAKAETAKRAARAIFWTNIIVVVWEGA